MEGLPEVRPLVGELQGLFRRRLATRAIDLPDGTKLLAERVFHRRGKRIRDFREAWKKAREAAGLPSLFFHDLRRSAVRELRRSGVQERVCMQITGHRTRAIFDRYNIVDENDLADAMKRRQSYRSSGSTVAGPPNPEAAKARARKA